MFEENLASSFGEEDFKRFPPKKVLNKSLKIIKSRQRHLVNTLGRDHLKYIFTKFEEHLVNSFWENYIYIHLYCYPYTNHAITIIAMLTYSYQSLGNF